MGLGGCGPMAAPGPCEAYLPIHHSHRNYSTHFLSSGFNPISRGNTCTMYEWNKFTVVFHSKPDYNPDQKQVDAAVRHRKELGGTLFFDRIWNSLGLDQGMLPADTSLHHDGLADSVKYQRATLRKRTKISVVFGNGSRRRQQQITRSKRSSTTFSKIADT